MTLVSFPITHVSALTLALYSEARFWRAGVLRARVRVELQILITDLRWGSSPSLWVNVYVFVPVTPPGSIPLQWPLLESNCCLWIMQWFNKHACFKKNVLSKAETLNRPWFHVVFSPRCCLSPASLLTQTFCSLWRSGAPFPQPPWEKYS